MSESTAAAAPDSAAADEPADPGRRRALLVGGGVLALVIGGGVGWLIAADDDDPSTGSLPSDPSPTATDELSGVVNVGERYLDTHPDEDDLTGLLAALPDAGDDPVAAAAGRVAAEFGRGETVMVDGWVLAVSEARAAAVVALRCRAASC